MQLRTKGPLLVLAAASAIFGAANYAAYRSQVAFIDGFKNQDLRDIGTELKTGLQGLERGATNYAELVATLPTVKAAFKARDRERLGKELIPSYRLARSKYSAEQGSFQTPDLKTFLRLMRPENFGDDVSHRDMMVRANHEKKTQSGLETSTTRASVRAVVPVLDGEEHLGSFEWGFSFTRFLQRVQENNDAEVALLIDEKMLAAPITTAGQAARATAAKAAEADRILEGYRTVEATSLSLMKRLVTKDLVVEQKDVKIRSKIVDEIEHGIVALPINDYRGRVIGALFVVKSMAGPQRAVKATRVTFAAATIVGLVLLAGAVQLVFNGLLVRPLVEIAENLDAITGGNVGVKIDLKKRPDEIGVMARDLDRLRDRLAKEKEAAERAAKVSERASKIDETTLEKKS